MTDLSLLILNFCLFCFAFILDPTAEILNLLSILLICIVDAPLCCCLEIQFIFTCANACLYMSSIVLKITSDFQVENVPS